MKQISFTVFFMAFSLISLAQEVKKEVLADNYLVLSLK